MTDKQIIIDGVDVSVCSWYTQGATGMICADWHISNDCSKNPNCYYKQHKRSEAQCEAMFVTHTDLEKKYKAKEQECERLKDIADHNGRVCNKRLDKIDELEHNINELNEQLEAYKMEAEEGKEINAELKAENERFKEILDELFKIQYKLADNNKKLRQCLTEIKELIQSDYCTEIGSCKFCAEIGNCLNRKILQKISECEG